MTYNPLDLMSVARECRRVYDACASESPDLFGGSLLDLLADNIEDVPLDTLIDAIAVSGIYACTNDRIRKSIAKYERESHGRKP